MKKIIIYSTPYCGFCQAAKRLLDDLKVPFDDVDLAGDDELREKLSEKYHWMTVPMIVIGDEFIGGFDDLKKLHNDGSLAEKLEEDE